MKYGKKKKTPKKSPMKYNKRIKPKTPKKSPYKKKGA